MNSPSISESAIRYADFIRICRVQDPAYFQGFRVETNGLYTIEPDRDVPLTYEERATLSWHPTGHFDQPALPFPCTVAQLKTFVDDAGLAGCIDETAMAGLAEVPGNAPAVPTEVAIVIGAMLDPAELDAATPVTVVSAGVSYEWTPITSLARAPGYRWPLYQFMKATHRAGKPCPKPRDFLDWLKLNPNPDLQVMPDGLKYDGVKQKEANLKAIQQAIKGLLQ